MNELQQLRRAQLLIDYAFYYSIVSQSHRNFNFFYIYAGIPEDVIHICCEELSVSPLKKGEMYVLDHGGRTFMVKNQNEDGKYFILLTTASSNLQSF